MFKSVRIQNFRQFRDLKLDGLAQINLITGANDTGKTSLLEALALLLSPTAPEIVRTIANIRGIDTIGVEGPDAWGWIFHDGAD
jgi:AAA15 family ATPase/GTPase